MARTYVIDGDRLLCLRERALMSQEVLSARSGFSKAQICRYETGRVRNPRHSSILKLARGLGCDPRELVLPIIQEGEEQDTLATRQVSAAL